MVSLNNSKTHSNNEPELTLPYVIAGIALVVVVAAGCYGIAVGLNYLANPSEMTARAEQAEPQATNARETITIGRVSRTIERFTLADGMPCVAINGAKRLALSCDWSVKKEQATPEP